MEHLKVGEMVLYWLDGGVTHLDGGAMFGVVPKPLWSKKYSYNDKNQIELRTDPIFFQLNGNNIIIDAGIGNGKLTDKQKRNYGVTAESRIDVSLKEFGLAREDIDIVLMTHLHFDHACGLTIPDADRHVPSFPNAVIYVPETEWEEMRHPNIRSKSTYWKENWEAVQDQVQTFKEEITIEGAVRMIHTGGHSDGHAIITGESGGEKWIHMADLLPTHAHRNPLWVMAYDDYPMTSIFQKQKWIDKAIQENAWFVFYHDAIYRALKWDAEGNIVAKVERERNPES
ncbi:putative quorum-quenching lactonase YtnP [Weizmannia acidilactici]|uniref:Quorum-quenching lactonase YtnP n=1 Tax=Weizmannia acidilactici TaxID=2607726 RepID=A0A5J4JGE1_9BACI|nr:MBL fold metallo-hydrolase [Weizmannia acidilactici]GER66456.1 putative quorum-quenching lactonase YtnP [Weizmannia acidilactici]GER69398.1 putative quorum-quenching lactonase YtnP [Weizmannia acidilactici]